MIGHALGTAYVVVPGAQCTFDNDENIQAGSVVVASMVKAGQCHAQEAAYSKGDADKAASIGVIGPQVQCSDGSGNKTCKFYAIVHLRGQGFVHKEGENSAEFHFPDTSMMGEP